MKVAHFYAYGVIGENDPYFKVFTGEDDPVISSKKVSDFLNANADADEIVVHINSRGGSVDEGFAIHDLLTNSGKKIITRVEGQASSIASVVFLAGVSRQITENSVVMIHNPWIDPTIMVGLEADEIIKIGNDMKQAEDKILNFYADKTGGSKDQISSFMKDETTFDANTALELKFATEILTPVKAFAYIKNNKIMSNEKENPFGKAEKMLSDIWNKIKGVKAEGVTEVVETPTETPAETAEVNAELEELKKQNSALTEENATLKTEIETLKSDSEKTKEDFAVAIDEVKKEIVAIKKNVKSDFQPKQGQTVLNSDPSKPNRVLEAKEKYAKKNQTQN